MNRNNKDFLNRGSVCASLSHMIRDFCKFHNLTIPAECSLYDLDDRIPFNVWCMIINKIDEQFKTNALGLKIADFVKPAYAGIVSYISFSKPTLLEAIPDFIKYIRLAYDLNYMYFQVKDSEIEFSWDDHMGQPGLAVDECAIALFLNIVKHSISPYYIPPKCINFLYDPPNNIEFYKNYFGCPVFFNSPTTSIVISLDSLKNIPLAQPDPYLYRILKNHADLLIEKLENYNEFEYKIRLCIITNINNKKINIDIIAEQMGMPQKKLREILLSYGYSFNSMLSDVRFNLAKKYLLNEKLNISEIAFLLGYSEQSVFQRSFKSWSGLTPLKWRENNK
ncbi:AraC family transcriptional regulator [Acinetobacter sp. C26M]|uniref:AraC family transcriptional regulator n=1 Tax=unclassified Acinetobacter TaxID=196816 RepID=UPI002036B4B2|nr:MULTISPECIES: AraC family transcriptional regulator [unclassified Acinetobacter]USA47470.1 AraC family transcriptional regulator [Acinetobacter sp. C26M]USA50951.1 AraC family transcriptional regulator [Acinetobacter sp. C26G]